MSKIKPRKYSNKKIYILNNNKTTELLKPQKQNSLPGAEISPLERKRRASLQSRWLWLAVRFLQGGSETLQEGWAHPVPQWREDHTDVIISV